ncbi:MAG: hypothetical protein EOO17_05865 [Chloroflexi bacterium]|nr:MAG: hypothetical protein EOO17_05865 [Chloroflexota bacterium]
MKRSSADIPEFQREPGYSASEIADLSRRVIAGNFLEPEIIFNDTDTEMSQYSWVHPKDDQHVTLTVSTAPQKSTFYFDMYIRPLGSNTLVDNYSYSVDNNGNLDIDLLDESNNPADWQSQSSKIIAGMKIVNQLRDLHGRDRPTAEVRTLAESRSKQERYHFLSIATHELLSDDIMSEKIQDLHKSALNDVDKKIAIELLIAGIQNNHPALDSTHGRIVLKLVVRKMIKQNNAV